MKRGLWFVAGAGAGIWAVTRARRAAEAFTPDGLRDRLNGLVLGAQMLRDEFTAGATETEAEIRHRIGLVPDGPPELTAAEPGPDPGAGTSPEQLATRAAPHRTDANDEKDDD